MSCVLIITPILCFSLSHLITILVYSSPICSTTSLSVWIGSSYSSLFILSHLCRCLPFDPGTSSPYSAQMIPYTLPTSSYSTSYMPYLPASCTPLSMASLHNLHLGSSQVWWTTSPEVLSDAVDAITWGPVRCSGPRHLGSCQVRWTPSPGALSGVVDPVAWGPVRCSGCCHLGSCQVW